MYRFYPLLFYTGLAGMLSLLGLSASPRLSRARAALTAAWLTLLTLIWMLVPRDLHWLFSLWSPLPVLRGALLVDLTPALWRLGLVLGLTMSGVAWVEVAERRHSSSVGEALALLLLLALWLLISGGSLLLTLTAWALFDLLVSAALLIGGGDGEQVSFTLMLNGFATLLLWAAALLAGQEGVSTLWRVMWPLPSIYTLLMVAVAVRTGLYPFQLVVSHRRPEGGLLLRFATAMQPILGVVLFYRLLTMPGALPVPRWFTALAMASLLWGALLAWAGGGEGGASMRHSLYAVMGAVVIGALPAGGTVMLAAAGSWMAVMALGLLHRGVERRWPLLAWPVWLGTLFLLGLPPSPIGEVYRSALLRLPWAGRPLLLLGVAAALVPWLRYVSQEARAHTAPPWPQQQVALAVGTGLTVAALVINGTVRSPSLWGMTGWGLLLATTGALAFLGRRWMDGPMVWLRPFLDFIDLRWLYRALWRGWDHLLAGVRAAAEIVEGRGALIWSLLIVLITLLMAVKR